MSNLSPEERIERIRALLREMHDHTAEARHQILAATEQLLEQARARHEQAVRRHAQAVRLVEQATKRRPRRS